MVFHLPPVYVVNGSGHRGERNYDVPQTVGVVTCGVTLIIENTLSLTADKHSKIKSAIDANGPVCGFHLDLLKSGASKMKLLKYLKSLTKDTNTSIFIYSSPEVLIRKL